MFIWVMTFGKVDWFWSVVAEKPILKAGFAKGVSEVWPRRNRF
jgi:hypothetical protein